MQPEDSRFLLFRKYQAMKRRRIRWARHIVCTERQDAHKILVGNPERRKPNGKIILQGISQLVVCGLDSSGS
jgi:hypothetical protein